ncbi:MAG: hypothetical protein MJY42_01600 [Bacteroidales bacterium]|nr:hypothetical protein [Bacteroidales bacterium]
MSDFGNISTFSQLEKAISRVENVNRKRAGRLRRTRLHFSPLRMLKGIVLRNLRRLFI